MKVIMDNDIAPQEEFVDSMKRLFLTGTYSDLTITNGPETYYVHKAMVLPRSNILSKAYDGKKNIILAEDPTMLKLIIHYLYLLDYPPVSGDDTSGYVVDGYKGRMDFNSQPSRSPHIENESWGPDTQSARWSHVENQDWASGWATIGGFQPGHQFADALNSPDEYLGRGWLPRKSSNLYIHIQVSELADRYELPGLKALAMRKFASAAKKHWDSAEFVDALKKLYGSSGYREVHPVLRDAVVDTMCANPGIMRNPDVQKIMQGGTRTNLSHDVLMRRVSAESVKLEEPIWVEEEPLGW